MAAEFVTRGTALAPPLFPVMILFVVFLMLSGIAELGERRRSARRQPSRVR